MLLTLSEVADRLRKSKRQIEWMRYQGDFPRSALIGGRVMVREDDLDAWLNAKFGEVA